ncbi:IS66 family transposase [Sporomusa sp.]|uniref:IS66 family transposase n=1 Tax=Sporomusa sp. TaxID=2078658 RepID=UPI00297674C3|nr:transposase [Sporomusa sp.]MDF2570882.1 transposase family protein [Sporomusa sp.]HWR05692.1 transposase [Sporomusa sp.]
MTKNRNIKLHPYELSRSYYYFCSFYFWRVQLWLKKLARKDSSQLSSKPWGVYSGLTSIDWTQKSGLPVIEAFFTWMDNASGKTLPQSLLGKAFTYAQNQKKYLLAFLTDGRIELSNNRAERSIKPFVIGRKNWLFCNTPGGAQSSAAIYSLIQTAIANGLKPQAYLEYVFKQSQ